MSDDELKVWAERQTEDPRSAAVLRLLAERDRLAAELAILKKGEPTDAELMAAAVDAQRRADNYAKKLGELSTELAELRAWKEQALAVEREWDAQALAKMLGVPLGQSCRKGIGERVPTVLKELTELRIRKEQKIAAERERCLAIMYNYFADQDAIVHADKRIRAGGQP